MEKRLSLIIPTCNRRQLAIESVRTLRAFAGALTEDYEIIVVDDGSTGDEQLQQADLPEGVLLITHPQNRGKGAAIRSGMLAACGHCRIFTDVDLPYDLEFIPQALRLIESGYFHFVAGDRTHKSSRCGVEVSLMRSVTSAVLCWLVQLLVMGGIFDTQCGFKAFSGSLAEILFPLLTIDRFGFDVELFYLLYKCDITIKRLPVCLSRQGASSVSPLADGASMACDVLKLPLKWHLHSYAVESLLKFED